MISSPSTELLFEEVYSKWLVLYPLYFDKARTIAGGRRVSMERAAINPAAADIIIAANKLGFECHLENVKRHPRDPFTYGRVRVNPFINNDSTKNISTKKNVVYQISTILPSISSEKKKNTNEKSNQYPLSNTQASTSKSLTGTNTTGPNITIRRKEKKKKK